MQNESVNKWETKDEAPLPYARRNRIAWFGGSFDPVHNGHLQVASKIIELKLCDEVIFIPASIPPHKTDAILLSGADRLEMLKIATEPFRNIGYTDIELRREGVSYTYDTLSLLKRVYSDCDMLFVIGMDSLCQLHTWYRAADLVRMVDFIVYPRPGVTPPMYLELEKNYGPVVATKLEHSILPDSLPLFDFSSSNVRERLARGEDISALVPEGVYDYIKRNGLYKGQ